MPQLPRPLEPHVSVVTYFGAELRRWRELRGLSQGELGGRVHVSGALISKIEKGLRRPSLGLGGRLDTVLDTAGVLARLEEVIDSGLPPASAESAGPSLRQVSPRGVWGGGTELADVLRDADREVAELLAGLEATNLGPATIEHLQGQVRGIARAYVHAPLPPLFARLLDLRRHLSVLLAGRQPLPYRRDLVLMTGAVLGLQAHACDDLGQVEAATTHARAGLACARQVGHVDLAAWIAGTLSKILDLAGDHHEAARAAFRARQGGSGSGQVVRLAALEARAWAHLGADERTQAALRTATEPTVTGQVAAGDLPDWGGVFVFPEAKRRYYAGNTLLWLGRYEHAASEAATAIEMYASGPSAERSYGDEACARADLAAARVHAGDLDAASVALAPLAALPANRRVAGLTAHLELARRALAQRPGTGQVSHVAEQIRLALPAPTPT